MKSLFIFILAFFIQLKSIAQYDDKFLIENYQWKSEGETLKSAVKIYAIPEITKRNVKIPILYFIEKNSDSAEANKFLNNISTQFEDSILPFIFVKISFDLDSFELKNCSTTSTIEFMQFATFSEIAPYIEKKYSKNIDERRVFVSGINDGALAALYCCLTNPRKINNTGLFFSNYNSPEKVTGIINFFATVSLAGKIFMYVSGKDDQYLKMDSFADNLAKSAGTMLYKIDGILASDNVNLFSEFYRWLNSKGNNYIIRTNDIQE